MEFHFDSDKVKAAYFKLPTMLADIFCIRASRVSEIMAPGIRWACKKRGYQCYCGKHQISSSGGNYGTNMVVSK